MLHAMRPRPKSVWKKASPCKGACQYFRKSSFSALALEILSSALNSNKQA
jgi:hypothetical protein